MKNITRKLTTMTVLIVLSILTIEPAMARPHRSYQPVRHGYVQPTYRQPHYNANYQNVRYGLSAGHRVQARGHGIQYQSGYGHNNYRSYGNSYNRHGYGVAVVTVPVYGNTH